jgi:hypothetical protein
MACGVADLVPKPGDEQTRRALSAFFDVLRLLLERGVTVVAEAAFQDHVWTPNLAPLASLAELRVVQCHTDAATARRRVAERVATRRVHTDDALLDALKQGDRYSGDFRRVAIQAPAIDVDTTDGYKPTIEELVAFVETASGARCQLTCRTPRSAVMGGWRSGAVKSLAAGVQRGQSVLRCES